MTALPTLPDSLEWIYCYENKLKTLPKLPTSLIYLDCSGNQLTSLPQLPDGLEMLYAYNNIISGTLDLSSGTSILDIDLMNNRITAVKLSSEAPYEWINLSENYLRSLSYVTGRNDIVWDDADGLNYQFAPQKNYCELSKEHVYGSYKVTTKATFGKSGVKTATCKYCGKKKTAVIPAVKTPTLSTATYTYSGKVKKPAVTVKNSSGTKLTSGTDYSVSYASGRKNVGKYKVTVKLKGAYSGSKTIYFKINPQTTSVSKLTKAKKAFTVKWKKKSTQVTGYQIRYSTSSKMTGAKTVTVKSYKTTSKTIKSLKAKKKYYVQVRTYKTVNGTKYYSAWSTKKSVTTK